MLEIRGRAEAIASGGSELFGSGFGDAFIRIRPEKINSFGTLAQAISLAASYYEVRHSAMELAAERLTSLSKVLTSLMEQQSSSRLALMHRVARDSAVTHALTLAETGSPLVGLAPLPHAVGLAANARNTDAARLL